MVTNNYVPPLRCAIVTLALGLYNDKLLEGSGICHNLKEPS